MVKHKLRNRRRVFLGKRLADNGHAGRNTAAVRAVFLPCVLEREIDRKLLILQHSDRRKRLRQHADRGSILRQRGYNFRGFGLELNRQVGFAHAGFIQQVLQRPVRRSTLTSHIDRFALKAAQIGQRFVMRNNIQHIARVNIEHLHTAIGFLIQRCRQIGGDQRNIDLTLSDQRHNLVTRGVQVERVMCVFALVLIHQAD